jgi:uncharacterized membrane protein
MAAVCLAIDVIAVPSHAQDYFATEWSGGSVNDFGGLPQSTSSEALGINNAGQVVGWNYLPYESAATAVEWSAGSVVKLGNLPYVVSSAALSINSAGQAVGWSYGDFNNEGESVATEWSGGTVINLGGLPGSRDSEAVGINNAGQAVGWSLIGNEYFATEWTGGAVIDLGPGKALGINNAGQIVGWGLGGAIEWSGGAAIHLGPGQATGINNTGQVVGFTSYVHGGLFPAEWSGGAVINLGDLPGSTESLPQSINDAGQVVGVSYYDYYVGSNEYSDAVATEWSGGVVIALGGLPGTIESNAFGINNAGQVVGFSSSLPEPSTWAMLLLGFVGLGFAGYRRVNIA